MKWTGKRVVVTGGAGFIGSTIVGQLLSLGADVTVVDKVIGDSPDRTFGARKVSRLMSIFDAHEAPASIVVMDLTREVDRFEALCKNADVVFHLSALFGGREFVDIHQVECSRMLAADHNAIEAAHRAGVERFHYASSACVYPPDLQKKTGVVGGAPALKETDVVDFGHGGMWWKASDNLYGWAKLMGELQCQVYHDEKGLKTSTCRYLTVYGPGELDGSHAIAALTERALDREDPFVVWGSGKQERGFTYVTDIAEGSIRAAEVVEDGTPVNLGTDDRRSVDSVAMQILGLVGYDPEIVHDISKPEGPESRGLDISRAKALLGWEPKVSFEEGIERTVDWHKEMRTYSPAPV